MDQTNQQQVYPIRPPRLRIFINIPKCSRINKLLIQREKTSNLSNKLSEALVVYFSYFLILEVNAMEELIEKIKQHQSEFQEIKGPNDWVAWAEEAHKIMSELTHLLEDVKAIAQSERVFKEIEGSLNKINQELELDE